MGSYLAHGPEIYPKAHKNPRAFSCISGPIYLEFSIQCPCGVGLHHTLRAEYQHFASVHDDNPCVASISYFGFIEEIWELNYVKFIVCVFKCKWVDSNTSARTDDVGFTLVDLKKLAYHNDPFIMAEQAK